MESREYALLKTAVIESNASSNNTVEILCDNPDALLLLKRATEFYPEALAFIQLGLNNCA